MTRRLIIRPGAIGDFIVSLPAMESLRWGYTEAWTGSPNVPLARFADAAKSIASTGLDRLGITIADDVIDRLRKFDAIVSWYGANRPDFRELVRALDLPFEFQTALPPAGAGVHAVDFYLNQLGLELGGVPRIAAPKTKCASRRNGFAVIHPFAASARKRWPLARFEQLARRLEKRMPVRWCCGPEDDLPGAVRIPDLYELGCWLAEARVFIGNDSGIGHLAAAVGTPVVAIFGPTDPAIWAPRGAHVAVVAKSNLEDISISEVEDAIG
ncbi:MAG: glycosyltransferase family 9 protein [Acidobacteriota bacterium]|nr:glycosyltransferase family 9 protein [Acidobacteriota bacterium]